MHHYLIFNKQTNYCQLILKKYFSEIIKMI